MEPGQTRALAAVLPCTHPRTCRFLSAGSARNPPAGSAATGRHWSSSCPLPVTAPCANDGKAPTVHDNRYFEEKHTASENPSPDPVEIQHGFQRVLRMRAGLHGAAGVWSGGTIWERFTGVENEKCAFVCARTRLFEFCKDVQFWTENCIKCKFRENVNN